MNQSKLFYKASKESPKDAETISHKFLARADFIDQLATGIYTLLPLGYRVMMKIQQIIREEMNRIGSQEVLMPTLQPKNLWEETGRWDTFDPPLFKLKDRHNKELALGPTHEEVITDLVRQRIKSYRDLPQALFQIQNKFRNEMRATGGLLRTREFLMKDLYSFHESKEDAVDFYGKVRAAYFKIFKRCDLDAVCVEADPGTIGGELSNEFTILSDTGEDRVLICEKCGFGANVEKSGEIKNCPKCKKELLQKRAIECGHIFFLGEKYSKPMHAYFIDRSGKRNPIMMGCYGIGLGRLMSTIVEVHNDERGIIWPEEVAPFKVHIIPVENMKRNIHQKAEKISADLQKDGFEVLYDDREDKLAGEKFAEADLIGIPYRIIVSEKTLKSNSVEIKKRQDKQAKLVKINALRKFFGLK